MLHKSLFPLDGSDLLGSALIFIGLVVASSGGIGGGGIIVPVLLLIFDFDSRHAIPLSNIAIFGSAIINLIFNATRRHPFQNRSLIDWDAVLIMEPLTMIGAIAGSLLNHILPNWLVMSSLDVILVAVGYQLLCKGITDFKKESAITDIEEMDHDEPVFGRRENKSSEIGNGKKGEMQKFKGNMSDTCGGDENKSSCDEDDERRLPIKEEKALDVAPSMVCTSSSSSFSPSEGGWTSHLFLSGQRSYGSIVHDGSEATVTDNDPFSLHDPPYSPVLGVECSGGVDLGMKNVKQRENFDVEHGTKDEDDDTGSLGGRYSNVSGRTGYGRVALSDSRSAEARGRNMLARLNSPAAKIVWLSTLFLLITSSNLSKCAGGLGLYWGLSTAMLLTVLLSTVMAGALLHIGWRHSADGESDRRTGTEALIDDPRSPSNPAMRPATPPPGIQWSLRNTMLCPALCVFAGIFAGVWGIGGGFIKGPLLLYLSLAPEAAAATSATMIFFTSLVATTSYFAFGVIVWDYSLYLFLLGVVATLVGQILSLSVVQKKNRSSLVPLCMGSVLLVSALLMTVETLHSRSTLSPEPRAMHFPPALTDLCTSGRE